MRIRSIKPEFWESLDTARLDYFQRLLFIGLWNYVDDNGVGIDTTGFIHAKLFPHDEGTEVSRMIHGGLTELSRGGQITRYTGPDGRPYLFITNWKDHQRINRPTKSKKPLPTSDGCTLREDSLNTHGGLTDDSRPEQGSKGARERGSEGSPYPPAALVRQRPHTIAEPPPDPEDDRHTPALVHDDGAPTAFGVVREWERASESPLTDSTRTAMRIAVSQCLRAGHEPPVIAQGIADWAGSPITATSQIPSFVDRAAVKPRLTPAAPTHQHNADAWLDLGRQMEQETHQ